VRGGGPYDLILANILPNTLIALGPEIRRHLAPGGRAVLSGILTFQVGEVRAAYRALGFTLDRLVRREGWTILTLRRG
jgi:ribosomal protein L11 methyltransferase